MKLRSPSILAPLLAILFAAVLHTQMLGYAREDNSEPFHQRVRELVEAIPVIMGQWEGTDIKPPDAAGKLLRPNALRSIHYRDSANGRWARLVVIHCRDSRDMSGHYPPNCYRGSGWTQTGPPIEREYTIGGTRIPIAEYRFTRTEMNKVNDWLIYDFFVLPAAGFATSMEAVQAASGEYQMRPYGAAQIQVIMDSSLAKDERNRILHEMLAPLGPVTEALQLKRQGPTP